MVKENKFEDKSLEDLKKMIENEKWKSKKKQSLKLVLQ
jgi:hypothetical protein